MTFLVVDNQHSETCITGFVLQDKHLYSLELRQTCWCRKAI